MMASLGTWSPQRRVMDLSQMRLVSEAGAEQPRGKRMEMGPNWVLFLVHYREDHCYLLQMVQSLAYPKAPVVREGGQEAIYGG